MIIISDNVHNKLKCSYAPNYGFLDKISFKNFVVGNFLFLKLWYQDFHLIPILVMLSMSWIIKPLKYLLTPNKITVNNYFLINEISMSQYFLLPVKRHYVNIVQHLYHQLR